MQYFFFFGGGEGSLIFSEVISGVSLNKQLKPFFDMHIYNFILIWKD